MMNSLSEEVRSKLKVAGIRAVADYVSCPPERIASKTGIPYKEVVQIRRKFLHQFGCHPVAASDLWKELSSTSAVLPTGCRNLDELLDGGLLTGELTEVCGPPGAGKTQVCLSVASHVAMTTSSTVAYIDCAGTFDAQLVERIVASRLEEGQESVESSLSRIRVFNVFSIFHLLSLLSSLQEDIVNQVDVYHSNLHLVMIDPVTSLISPHLGGHQTHGHSLMVQLVLALRVLANEHALAVLYTNNMVMDFNSVGGGLKPALGLTWSHTPSTRVTLGTTLTDEEGEPLKLATITKSSKQLVGVSTTFTITSSGVQ